jgi:hypothetical protein
MSKDWICKRCLHATSTKSNLLSHLRNKKHCSVDTEEGGIDVPIIQYIEDLLTVTQEPKKFSCPHCNYQFNHSQSMYRHFKTCKIKNTSTNNIDDKDKLIEELQAQIEYYEQQGQSSKITINKSELDKNLVKSQIKDELYKHIDKKINQLFDNTSISTDMILNNDNENMPKKYKKKNIPHAVKINCWNTHVGELVAKTKCMCCDNIDITQHNFHCGHIMAECHGGSYDMSNLLPICNVCNSSMGSTNMDEFRQLYGFIKV